MVSYVLLQSSPYKEFFDSQCWWIIINVSQVKKILYKTLYFSSLASFIFLPLLPSPFHCLPLIVSPSDSSLSQIQDKLSLLTNTDVSHTAHQRGKGNWSVQHTSDASVLSQGLRMKLPTFLGHLIYIYCVTSGVWEVNQQRSKYSSVLGTLKLKCVYMISQPVIKLEQLQRGVT